MKHLITTLFIFTLLTSSLQSHAATVQLPKTGQTTSYAAGDDGDLEVGLAWPNLRFTDNGDQSVTDNLTGLMWVKDGDLMKTRDPLFCATFDNAGIPTVPAGATWQQALDYVKKLNTDKYLGYSDWRMPNSIEQASLINKNQYNFATWLAGKGFTNVQNKYWTSSTSGWDASKAWSVTLGTGSASAGEHVYKFTFLKVWPVRGGTWAFGSVRLPATSQTICYNAAGQKIACSGSGQDGEVQAGAAWPSSRFTDNSLANATDKSITDNLTGLIWSKDANLPAAAKSWQQALDYIKTLNSITYAGHSDWRLPNINELESLANRGTNSLGTFLKGAGFINIQDGQYYWSSTSEAVYDSSAWVMYMNFTYDTSTMQTQGKVPIFARYFVWPVRGGQVSADSRSLYSAKTGSGSGTVVASPGEINCGSVCTAVLAKGAQVMVSATPDNGSIFTGWSGQCSGTKTCVFIMDTATSVTATFMLAAINGVCDSSNGAPFVIKPTANFCTTGTASIVTGSGPWSWTCAGSNGGTTANCNTTIQSWTINSGNGANGTVSCTSPVNNGDASICTVTPSTGYQLATFTDNNIDKKSSVVGTVYTISNVTIGHTIAATFSLIPPAAVNGSCGTSNGGTFSLAPTANLCTAGTEFTNVTGSSSWNWLCAGTNSGTTAICAANSSTAPTSITTKAKVYLGTDDSFTISSNGTTLYGSSGIDTVIIAAGISGVTLDQNVERINLSGSSNSYKFKQTGNKINVYDSTGATMLANIPVQGDSDGTVIGFSDGYASALLSGGVMTLGGATVSTTAPNTLAPTLQK